MTAQLPSKFTIGELKVIAETDHVQCGDAAAMARALLAGMEQEPDLYLCPVTRNGERLFSPCGRDYPRGRGYYTRPAPVTAVPDIAAVGEIPFLGTQEKAFVSGWNACRAAMLSAAPKGV